jgi:16S rRNA processing protein RimM
MRNDPTQGRRTPHNFLPVARLTGLFGVHGELKCRPSSAGEEAIVENREFFLDPQGRDAVVPTVVHRLHKRIVVKLRGVESIEAARPFVGKMLYLPREALTLREGEFLDEDLIGARLFDPQGQELGAVGGIEHFPAHACLIIEPGHVLLPMVRAFIREIDVAARRIIVTLPEGLLDPREAENA